MALRVGSKAPPPVEAPPPEEMAAPPMEAPPMEEEVPPMEEAPMDKSRVEQLVAGYKGPEFGPFMCQNCQFYQGEGNCSLVSGPIDPEGLCNLFTPMDEAAMLGEEGAPPPPGPPMAPPPPEGGM